MSERIEVSRDVLLQAVEYAQLDPPVVEEKFPKFNKWLIGEVFPTFKQLESFSNFTKYPFSFLFLDKPIELESVEAQFRSLQEKRVSPELRDMIFWMQSIQEWMSEYRQINQGERIEFIGALDPKSSVSELVNFAHSILKDIWPPSARDINTFYYLRDIFENLGIIVMRASFVKSNMYRKVALSEARGFSLADPYAPLIYINQADAQNGQVFTLLHEFMHLLIGDSNISTSTDTDFATSKNNEYLCNQATAEFLVPTAEIEVEADTGSYDDVKRLSGKFKVSEEMMAMRLYSLALIGSDVLDEVKEITKDRVSRKEERKQARGGGSLHSFIQIRARMSPVFVKNLIWRARDGTITYRDAYDLFGYKGATFKSFASKLLEE